MVRIRDASGAVVGAGFMVDRGIVCSCAVHRRLDRDRRAQCVQSLRERPGNRTPSPGDRRGAPFTHVIDAVQPVEGTGTAVLTEDGLLARFDAATGRMTGSTHARPGRSALP